MKINLLLLIELQDIKTPNFHGDKFVKNTKNIFILLVPIMNIGILLQILVKSII